jgi:uncharacterized protein YbjT (DUF2867 family)
MSKSTVILVTGATGVIGTDVCAALASQPGLEVRAALRTPAKRGWLPETVQTVAFDFEDPATIDAALDGVEKLFLLAPGGPKGPPFTRAVIDALKNRPIRQIVKQSSYEPGGSFSVPTDMWAVETETMVQETGIPWTFLQPPWCDQNFTRGYFVPMVMAGTLALPFGSGRSGWIDTRDVGAVAAKVFVEEGAHDGRSYCLTGPALIGLGEIADLLSAASGRQIAYQALSDQQWLDNCKAIGMPPGTGEATLALIGKTRDGYAARITDDVERLLGRPATTFEQFARDHAGEIRALRDTVPPVPTPRDT